MSLSIQVAKMEVVILEATFVYEDIPFLEKTRMAKEFIKNGKFDQDRTTEAAYRFMTRMVVGWKNIEDTATNKPLKFDKEYIKFLPADVAVNFLTKIVLPAFGVILKAADRILKEGKSLKQKEDENLESVSKP